MKKVVTTESLDDLQRNLSKLNTIMESIGFKINANKTTIIVLERRDEKKECDIASYEERVNQVDDFVYLRSIFTADGKIYVEISRRTDEGTRREKSRY